MLDRILSTGVATWSPVSNPYPQSPGYESASFEKKGRQGCRWQVENGKIRDKKKDGRERGSES